MILSKGWSLVTADWRQVWCGWILWKMPVCPLLWPHTIHPSPGLGLSRPEPGAWATRILLHQSYCREQTINSGAKLKVRGRVWKNRMTIIKCPSLALISLTSGLSQPAWLWLMPSFAYSGHRHEQHAPFTAPAMRFVGFLTPVESLKKHCRWPQVRGQSSSIIQLVMAAWVGTTAGAMQGSSLSFALSLNTYFPPLLYFCISPLIPNIGLNSSLCTRVFRLFLLVLVGSLCFFLVSFFQAQLRKAGWRD